MRSYLISHKTSKIKPMDKKSNDLFNITKLDLWIEINAFGNKFMLYKYLKKLSQKCKKITYILKYSHFYSTQISTHDNTSVHHPPTYKFKKN